MGKESISSGRSWESVLFWAFFFVVVVQHTFQPPHLFPWIFSLYCIYYIYI